MSHEEYEHTEQCHSNKDLWLSVRPDHFRAEVEKYMSKIMDALKGDEADFAKATVWCGGLVVEVELMGRIMNEAANHWHDDQHRQKTIVEYAAEMNVGGASN